MGYEAKEKGGEEMKVKQGSASEIPGESLREIRVGHDQDSACTCRKLSKNDYKTFLLRRMHFLMHRLIRMLVTTNRRNG